MEVLPQTLAEAEELVAKASSAQRPFMVPMLLAIERLGGQGAPKAVREIVRELYGDRLTDAQFEYLDVKKRFGWVRYEMKQAGLLGGEDGTWALTPVGREYLEAHRNDALELPPKLYTLDEQEEDEKELDTVDVTASAGYRIPLLAILADGVTARAQLRDELLRRYSSVLLPGDFRLMKNGTPVWRHRSGWELSAIGKDGEAENHSTGVWVITDVGRKRLEREREAWSIQPYQSAKQNVPKVSAQVDREPNKVEPTEPEPRVSWNHQRWRDLKASLTTAVFDSLSTRLRPDLGPSPTGTRAIARNVILYGPPGTGKTHIAKLVAQALTGDEGDAEDRRWNIVQFHPSYAYEDFIQGLRPSLTETTLLYRVSQGPFLTMAKAAENDPDSFFVLIIDEINRGDPARIFGELLYALEYRDEPVTLPMGGDLTVPSNLIVIGTMNSVDRSVALVDYALRRRFGFVRLDPDPGVIETVHDRGVLAELGGATLRHFNAWLTGRLDRDHAVGHSYFLNPVLSADDASALDRVWALDVAPLLEEYFFGDEDALRDAAAQWKSAVAKAKQEAAEVAGEILQPEPAE